MEVSCAFYKRDSQKLGAAQTEFLGLLLGTAELDEHKSTVTGERLQV
jgi:cyclopropane fatty-acyl-phospholipid synthase-like methyltransferase